MKELTAAGREPLTANKAAAKQRGVVWGEMMGPVIRWPARNPCDDLVRQLSWKARIWPLDPVPSNQHIALVKGIATKTDRM